MVASAGVKGLSAMKDRKKRCSILVPWSTFFLFTLFLVFSISVFTFFPIFYGDGFRPKLVSNLYKLPMEAVSGESSPAPPVISIQETVIFPDQVLVFLKYPSSTPLFTKDDISCIYLSSPNSSHHQLQLSPESVEDEYYDRQIVRCPLHPRGFVVSVSLKANGNLPAGPTYRWDYLAYEAMIDRDNTTVVFVKGFNLRSGRLADPSKFKCVYGWDFTTPKLTLQSQVVSIAQEVVRCQTPLSILNGSHRNLIGNNNNSSNSVKVSVRLVGRRKLVKSIARPELRLEPGPTIEKKHEICICTMLRNQARFLREWVIYHGQIGVGRWLIYDNNSADDIEDVVQSLRDASYNISRHVWPWIKTQEAGFAHCALRARDSCEWVAFIDVDEFFHSPSGLSLHNVLRNRSRPKEIAELRTSCHNFGPSGLHKVPPEGVAVGYTCRMRSSERHKSMVRPEAVNDTLINMVHHFHLKAGFRHANLDRNMLVINHYKYQVWEVFKEKFYMRVATYVSDWKQKRNVRSKDRTPGLGTTAVEPPNWASRFCQVKDTGLRERVIKTFADPRTGMLPWQEHQLQQSG